MRRLRPVKDFAGKGCAGLRSLVASLLGRWGLVANGAKTEEEAQIRRRREASRAAGWAAAAAFALALAPLAAQAAPTLRKAIDQKGDFVIVGNTVGLDCGSFSAPFPVVGAIGDCGFNTDDTSPDIFWRADSPTDGNALADSSIAVADARSTAVLKLPTGATVTYARMYWAAMRTGSSADSTAELARPGSGAFTSAVTADGTFTQPEYMGLGDRVAYQSTADVTALIQAHGEGAYRVAGIDSVSLPDLSSETSFIGWSIVVFYERPGDPPRRLALLDGLDQVTPGAPAAATLTGFSVPLAGFDAKLGVITYEGDADIAGDQLFFNGVALTDAQNPGDNFFNATRSTLGVAVSNAGDLPQLEGTAGSLAGMDLDIVNVTARVTGGDTSASVSANTVQDVFYLGAFVVSISTFKPDLSATFKDWVDNTMHAGGAVLPGDQIEYTISTTNNGNDPAIGVVMQDALPVGVTFVPGSIRVTAGANVGTKTDAADIDQGEYVAATRTVTVRLGTGATGVTGGTLAIGDATTVRFRVTIDQDAKSPIANQAVIKARGASGAPESSYPSDGNGPTAGAPPTSFPVDQCLVDGDCPMARPFCLTAPDPNVCVECRASGDCKTAAEPVCDAVTLACRGCKVDAECGGITPRCDVPSGTCASCLVDADCGGPLPFCDTVKHTCRACTSDTECAGKNAAQPACQMGGRLDGSCTECSATNDTRCGFPKPVCLFDWGLCGCSDVDGDSECGDPMSGIVCNGPAGVCESGCSVAPNRNGCPTAQICSDMTGAVGHCENGCVTDDMCMAPSPRCDTSVMPGDCVACLQDKDCPTPYVCDDGKSKTCVECTSGKKANCVITGNGTVCLTNDTCGCLKDSDCGGPMSGRVCDTAIDKCRTGCRGMGGNQCPMPLLCTSKTSDIGNCTPTGGPPEPGPELPLEAAPEPPPEPAVEAAPDPADAADAATDAAQEAPVDAARDFASFDATQDAQSNDDGGGQETGANPGGYLAGGGCKCETGSRTPAGSGGFAFIALLGLAVRLGRKRR